jgi:hypothetical protein
MPETVNYQGRALVSQAVAERSIAAKRQVGKNRVLPMKLRVIEDLKKQKVHVFNVGPWPQTVNTGSTGTFYIPKCPHDKDYIEMLVANPNNLDKDGNPVMEPPLSIIVEEMVIKSEDEMTCLTDDGFEFAQRMIGLGRSRASAFALTRFGIFVSMNAVPTAEEKENAHATLVKECERLVKWAADTYVTDRKLFSLAVRPDVHFIAARVLGRDNPQDSPWMLDASPQKRIKCKMCGRVCDPDVATCEAGHVVNMELFLDLKAAEEQLQAAVASRKAK